VFAASDEGGEDDVVSVVVVTHNNRALIGDCLEAIQRSRTSRELELIVVDNASVDGTAEVVHRYSPRARLIELEENVGFAAAVNRGRDAARGTYVALVNSDAFVDPGCIEALIARLDYDPRIGIAGARLRYPDGHLQASAGTFPSLAGGVWVALALHRAPVLSRAGVGYFSSEYLYRRARPVDWVSAAVCAARIDAGPLPSSSFMYGEDIEWAAACRACGRDVWLEPAATAVHIGRASVDESQAPSFAQRQRVQFELAWFARRGRAATVLARAVLLIHAAARLALFGLLALVRRRGDPRIAEFKALGQAAIARRPAAR
jgi:GT2 family glycosyltransferase